MDVMRPMYSIALLAMTVAASVEPGRGCAEGDQPIPSATVKVTTFYPPQ